MVKELPDLANNNTGCSVKFYFQINNEFKKKKCEHVPNVEWDMHLY